MDGKLFVGDVVEAWKQGRKYEEAEVVSVEDEGHLVVRFFGSGEERKLQNDQVLRSGQTELVWGRVLRGVKNAEEAGVKVGKVLVKHLRQEMASVEEFLNFVQELEKDKARISSAVMKQVLLQKNLLDKSGEAILFSKVKEHQSFAEMLRGVKLQVQSPKSPAYPSPIQIGRANGKGSSVSAADVELVFRKHEPVRISNITHLLADLRKENEALSPSDRDEVMKFFKSEGLGPRSDCSLDQILKLCKSLGILVGEKGASSPKSPTTPRLLQKEAEVQIQMRVKLANEQGVDCRELFESLDDDLSGLLSFSAFAKGLREIGVDLELDALRDILRRRFPSEDHTRVRYRDFFALIAPDHWELHKSIRGNERAVAALQKLRDMFQEAHSNGTNIDSVFSVIDKNKSGTIDRMEFRKALKQLGINLTKGEIRTLMRLFETKSYYQIDLTEFKTALLRPDDLSVHTVLMEDLRKVLNNGHTKGTDWRSLFETLDEQFSGSLPLHIVQGALAKYGFSHSEIGFKELLRSEQILTEEFEVDYPKLLCKFSPDSWLTSSGSNSRRNAVKMALDRICEIVGKATENGVSMEETFNFFDSDGDGRIRSGPFKAGLEKLGIVLDLKELRALMREFEDPKRNDVRFIEFVQTIKLRIQVLEKLREEIRSAAARGQNIARAFRKEDIDRTGKITLDEFVAALKSLGISASVLDLPTLVHAKYFNSTSTSIRFEEFLSDILGDLPRSDADYQEIHRDFEEEERKVDYNSVIEGKTDFEGKAEVVVVKSVRAVEEIIHELRGLLVAAKTQRNITLKDAFDHFDINGDRLISRKEFRSGLKSIGFSPSSEELTLLMNRFVEARSGKISLDQFARVFAGTSGQTKALSAIRKQELLRSIRVLVKGATERGINYRECFEHFDKDFSGTIDFKEFRTGLKRLGFEASDAETEALMHEYGTPHLNGQISYVNFLRMIGVDEEKSLATKLLKRIQLSLARLNATAQSIKAAQIAVATSREVRSFTSPTSSFSLRLPFSEYDANNDGIISRSDFLTVLASVDIGLRESDFHLLLRRLDPSADGVVDYVNFVELVEPERETLYLRNAARKLHEYVLKRKVDKRMLLSPFQHFDVDCSSHITKREFRCAMAALAFNLGSLELDILCDTLDLSNDGRVNYDEFIKFITPNSALSRTVSMTNVDKSGGAEFDLLNTFNIGDPLDALETDLQEFVAMAESMNIPLKETFRHFDKNLDGTISWEEFHRAMLELGFECTEEQLKKLMKRVRHYDSEVVPDDLEDSEPTRIDYNMFLAYWVSLKDGSHGKKVAKAVDQRTEKDILALVKRLKKELVAFLQGSTKRGVDVSEIFSHFDQNGDGKISVFEFELALKDIFADDDTIDERVVRKFISQIDESKDGLVDYYEFLGMRSNFKADSGDDAKKAAWQSIFGARRALKNKVAAQSTADSITLLIIRRAEQEIENKGPIWQEVRRNLAARLNNATFIQRNKSAAQNTKYCAAKARGIRSIQISTKVDSTPPSSARKKDDVQDIKQIPLAKRIAIAERMHMAEMAAARMAEEASLRAEESAHRQRAKTIEEEALQYALGRIHGAVFFLTKSRALDFLNSIGLARLEHRIAPVKFKGMENCFLFPIQDDHDLEQALGTGSTIVARKVKRELINVLRLPERETRELFPYADSDPEQWSIKQVKLFAEICGVSPRRLDEYEIDGESLLDLQPEEAVQELGFEDEIGIQILIFRAAFLHSLVRKRGQHSGMSSSSSTTSSGQSLYSLQRKEGEHGAGKLFLSLRLGQKVIPRPSHLPIERWTVDDVVRFAQSLDLPDNELLKLAVDGQTLLELSDSDIENELNIAGALCSRFRSAIEAVRQPPWMSLGTGPYFEARIAVAENSDSNEINAMTSQSSSVHQVETENCSYLAGGREHDIWVHIGPALTKAFDITQRALEEENAEKEKALRIQARKPPPIPKSPLTGQDIQFSFKEKDLSEEEDRIFEFVSKTVKSGLPVLTVLESHDVENEGFLTWHEFEKALMELGFNAPNPGLLRSVIQMRLDKTHEGRVFHREFYSACLNKAEHHSPAFDGKNSDEGIAFTTDGLVANLLLNSEGPSSTVLEKDKIVSVRYGGGSQQYDARVLSIQESGIYEVEYVDSGKVEFVSADWIELKKKLQIKKLPKDTTYQIARSDLVIQKGIHVWSTRIVHVNEDVVVGMSSSIRNRARFLGISARGDLVLKGYTERRERIISRVSRLTKKQLGKGDVLIVKLDLNAQEMRIFRGHPTSLSEEVVNFDTLAANEEIACVRFGKVYNSPELETIKQIKDFLVGYSKEVENALMARVLGKDHFAPLLVVKKELSNLGLHCADADLVDFLRPFMNEGKQRVDVKGLLEGLNLTDDRLWDSDGPSYGEGIATASMFQYSPAVLLAGAGDSVKWMRTRCAIQSARPLASSFMLNSRVEVRYGGGSTWYKGTVIGLVPNEEGEALFTIKYDDGDIENLVKLSNLRLLEEKVHTDEVPRARLVMKLFCRLLAYSAPREDRETVRQRKRAARSEKRHAIKAKVLQNRKHNEFILRAGESGDNQHTDDCDEVINAGEIPRLEVEMRGSSFSNVGLVRLHELLRKRLNEPVNVNWTHTTNAPHSFFAPLSVEQQTQKEFQLKSDAGKEDKGTLTEDEWTPLGIIDISAMGKVTIGEKGIPFAFRPSMVEPGIYYRLCFMGVLGTIDLEGCFSQVFAPVDPVQSMLSRGRTRVGGGYEHDIFASLNEKDEVSHRASRFFLLSGAFRTMASNKSLPTNTLRKTDPNRVQRSPKKPQQPKKFRQQRFNNPLNQGQTQSPRQRRVVNKSLSSLGSTAGKLETRPLPFDERHEEDVKQRQMPKKSPQTNSIVRSQISLSQDEKIVIDRWIAYEGFDEIEKIKKVQRDDWDRPLLFDDENDIYFESIYDLVVKKYPGRPWLKFARKSGWLPDQAEKREIRRWQRKNDRKEPSRLSNHQTIYEALVDLEPSKPWLQDGKNIRFVSHRSGRSPSPNKRTQMESPKRSPLRRRASPSPRKRNHASEVNIRREIEVSGNAVNSNLASFDAGYEEIMKGFKEAELRERSALSPDSKRAAAEEARALSLQNAAQANEEAQLKWEQQERARRLNSLSNILTSISEKEQELEKLNKRIEQKAVEQNWAKRVSDTYQKTQTQELPPNEDEDAFERALRKRGIPQASRK